MSALGLDDRRSAGGVFSYAPHQPRPSDDETSIRPVLERLNRGDPRGARPRQVRESMVQHAPPDDIGPITKSPVSMTVRLVVAAGVIAALAALGAGFLIPHDALDSTAPNATLVPPAPVPAPAKTVEIGKSDKIADSSSVVKDVDRLPQNQPVAADVSASAPMPAMNTVEPAPGHPAARPLQLWAMMPADLPAAAQPPAAQASLDQAPPPASKPAAADSPPKAAAAHHTRHVVHHRRSHSRRRATTARAPAQPVQPAETEAARAQAAKKLPLQAAIDRLFGNSAAGGAQPQQPPQPQLQPRQ